MIRFIHRYYFYAIINDKILKIKNLPGTTMIVYENLAKFFIDSDNLFVVCLEYFMWVMCDNNVLCILFQLYKNIFLVFLHGIKPSGDYFIELEILSIVYLFMILIDKSKMCWNIGCKIEISMLIAALLGSTSVDEVECKRTRL